MEYHHYSDLCVPSEHLLTDSYGSEYTQYMMPSQSDAEYECRGTIQVDGGDRFGVSSLGFDKFEELIWMGNQGGHVTSYYGPSMQKYTSFQIHETEEVRDIVTTEQGVYALTKSTLRHQLRRGIPKFTHRSPNMIDMQCLYQLSPTNLLMGGHQDKLIDLDLVKMQETIIPISAEGCAVARHGGGSLLALGSASGEVHLHDTRSPAHTRHSFRAHGAALSDLRVRGDLLLTCGFTDDGSGAAVPEPHVLVWDVRRLRGAGVGGAVSVHAAGWPTGAAPLLLHFLPAFSGRAVAVTGDGRVALLDLNDQKAGTSVFQVDTQNSQCSVLDVSSTSQALVFGDQGGHLHLFSPQHNHEPVFNNFSRETEFADPVVGLPFVGMNDTTFQFSSVSLPTTASGGRWFNELPETFYNKYYRKPKAIDPEVLKSMKMQGPIGYAPNPKTCKRNQMPYIEDTLDDLNSPKVEMKNLSQPIPKIYQKTDPRYPPTPPLTDRPGLEATIPNSYCNPMLQVLYYTPPVKATLLAHTCAKEFCLSCELGFLFRMLDTSNGAPCQATNFLRAFRTVPEAAALGLILTDRTDRTVDLVTLIQSWNRFILHQMHYEILETHKKEKELALIAHTANSPPKTSVVKNNQVNGPFDEYRYSDIEFLGPNTDFEGGPKEWHQRNGNLEGQIPEGNDQSAEPCDNIELQTQQSEREESEISALFAIGRLQHNRCLKCNKEEERESVALACALQYPSPSVLKENSECKAGFVELLLASLSSNRSTPAWCENCRKFSPTLQRGRVVRLPPLLAINCGGITAHEKAYWSKGTQKETNDGAKRSGSSKPCRYGLHCARPGCRFKHPDRPGSSSQGQNSSSKSPTRESNCVLPHQLNIRLTADGDIIINDKMESQTESSKSFDKSENGSEKQKKPSVETQEQYTLSAAVVCVEGNPKNLVAYVQLGDQQWYLFNDLSIAPVSLEEVIQCSLWWKTPCVAFYTSKNVSAAANDISWHTCLPQCCYTYVNNTPLVNPYVRVSTVYYPIPQQVQYVNPVLYG